MKYFRDRIGARLLLSYLVVLLVGVCVLLIGVIFSAPVAYDRHMLMMQAINSGTSVPFPSMMDPGRARGPGFAMGPGFAPGFNNFRDGLVEALSYAVIAAILVAVSLSIVFSRSIVAPLRAMMGASQRIAAGHYDERVSVSGADELGQLAERFNRMAENLEQTETVRRQLIGDVSHELRTPLTAIGGYMEGLQDGVLPATNETFEAVRQEASRLSRLVDDLQELSRVEAGAYSLEIRPLALPALVGKVTARLARQYAEKQVRLSVAGGASASFTPPLPLIPADEDRITQVLLNLLGNALAYTPAGGEVVVSAEASGAAVLVSVRDTGVGIPSASLEHIFDRFYRVDKSRSRASGGGSGIGLTIARAFVEAHGGSIHAASPGEGQGSTFSFSLPLSA